MKLFVLSMVVILTLSLATSAMAEEKEIRSPFKRLILKAMGLAGKTVEKEVKAVGKGVKKAADVVVEEVGGVGELVTGDTSKVKDVLVKPVTGTAEAVGETAHDVITAPIEAAEEVSQEEIK